MKGFCGRTPPSGTIRKSEIVYPNHAALYIAHGLVQTTPPLAIRLGITLGHGPGNVNPSSHDLSRRNCIE